MIQHQRTVTKAPPPVTDSVTRDGRGPAAGKEVPGKDVSASNLHEASVGPRRASSASPVDLDPYFGAFSEAIRR